MNESITEFEKYHKIKILGDEDNEGIFHNLDDDIIIEEKIDGGNFRFMFKGTELILGSHTRELDDDNPNCKTFRRCMEFVNEQIFSNIDITELKNYEGLIFYGECCIKHTMDYDWEKIPPYLGFDVKNMDTGKYLDYDMKLKLFQELGLPTVPLIKSCKAKDIVAMTDDNVPISVYASPSATDTQAEGVVMKNYKEQKFAKFVREKFKETNRAVFGMSKKSARQEGDSELLIATYCTNARLDKIIFKLIDEGYKLEMPLMHILPKRVMEDIYEENWKEICWSNWSINFKTLRQKIPKRCMAVLKQMITNQELMKK